MKVLVLATKYFGIGGAEAYTRMATRAVAEGGGEVQVLSLLDGEAADRSCPGRYLGHLGERSTLLTRMRFGAQAVRHGRGADLVLCSHVSVAPLGRLLFQMFRIPYLVVGYGIDVWGDVGSRRRIALQRAARNVVVSDFTARMVTAEQGVPRDRVCVVHPAVEPEMLALAAGDAPRSAGEAVVLLTVARLSVLERYKGCDAVIRALPAVRSRVGPVRYVIVGAGDDRPRLEALAREQGVAAVVAFPGPAQGAALAAHYRACDIFVMPSVAERRPGGWAGEGFGIVYIEAAAFGRPVVAGQGGGAPEAVQDGITGLVVDGSDVTAVAGALIRLGRNPSLRARMGETGRRWVQEHFTFDRFRREVAAVVGAAARRHEGGVASNQRL